MKNQVKTVYYGNNSNEEVESTNNFCKIAVSKRELRQFNCYLLKEITEPCAYIDLIQLLDQEDPETSQVQIIINSPGGNLNTTIQLISAMKNSQIPITTILQGEAHSAASMIFLAGDSFMITKDSSMLIHNFSAMDFGKGQELRASSEFRDKHLRKFMRDIYEGFLTEQELLNLFDDKDLWLDGEQISVRVNNKVKFLEKKKKELELQEQKDLEKQNLPKSKKSKKK